MKLRDDEPEVFVTHYCGKGHYMTTGKPVDHECRIIPGKALRYERDGDVRGAVDALQKARLGQRY